MSISTSQMVQSRLLVEKISSEKFSKGMAPKTFQHNIETYLKDSNAYTNIYFSRYFEWQGVCREHWFQRLITRDMLQKEGVLITKTAHNDFVGETFPFQTVRCLLNSYNVKTCSFYLIFRFFIEKKIVSIGYQQIVFANHRKKITRFPELILKKIKQYEIPC
jgi:enediyne core biosynthesis thioesterase